MTIDDFKQAKRFHEHNEIQGNTAELILETDGYILEFGVATGKSINIFAKCLPNRSIYGFDSFEGLPEPWIYNEIHIKPIGTFKCPIPIISDNVRLLVGLFQDTLPEWMKANKEDIALLHIDSDLYSSAIYVLEALNDRIKVGTYILFDDLYRWSNPNEYSNWQDGEWKALQEWLVRFDRVVKPISIAYNGWAGCVQVMK